LRGKVPIFQNYASKEAYVDISLKPLFYKGFKKLFFHNISTLSPFISKISLVLIPYLVFPLVLLIIYLVKEKDLTRAEEKLKDLGCVVEEK